MVTRRPQRLSRPPHSSALATFRIRDYRRCSSATRSGRRVSTSWILCLSNSRRGVPDQCGISAIGKVSSTSAPWVVTYTWFSSFMPSSPPGSPTYTSRHRTTPSSMTPS